MSTYAKKKDAKKQRHEERLEGKLAHHKGEDTEKWQLRTRDAIMRGLS